MNTSNFKTINLVLSIAILSFLGITSVKAQESLSKTNSIETICYLDRIDATFYSIYKFTFYDNGKVEGSMMYHSPEEVTYFEFKNVVWKGEILSYSFINKVGEKIKEEHKIYSKKNINRANPNYSNYQLVVLDDCSLY